MTGYSSWGHRVGHNLVTKQQEQTYNPAVSLLGIYPEKIVTAPQYSCVCAQSLQPCLTLCDSMNHSPPGFSVLDSPGKNTGVGCHSLLQEILTQELSSHLLCLLNWQADSSLLAPSEKPSLFIAELFTIAKLWKQPKYPLTDK